MIIKFGTLNVNTNKAKYVYGDSLSIFYHYLPILHVYIV